jgi:hypothetical protein
VIAVDASAAPGGPRKRRRKRQQRKELEQQRKFGHEPLKRAFGEQIAARFRGIYLFLLNKWYFDELYDFLFVRPALRIARLFWKIETRSPIRSYSWPACRPPGGRSCATASLPLEKPPDEAIAIEAEHAAVASAAAVQPTGGSPEAKRADGHLQHVRSLRDREDRRILLGPRATCKVGGELVCRELHAPHIPAGCHDEKPPCSTVIRHRIRRESGGFRTETVGGHRGDMGEGFMGDRLVNGQRVIKIKEKGSDCHKPQSLPATPNRTRKKTAFPCFQLHLTDRIPFNFSTP